MGTETNKDERNTPEYLAQLLKDKKQIAALPNVFVHAEKLLDEEINRVRITLFHTKGSRDNLQLPDPLGPVVSLQEKLFVPFKEHPDFNFVGRILGPRGMTAKELEQFTGCKIMVRGKGSMRDRKKEDMNRGKANWEHLNEDLHVLITVEDTRNRAEIKLAKAVEEVKKLLVPAPEGEDELKKKQLMELAILNGTYRDAKTPTHFPQQVGAPHYSAWSGLSPVAEGPRLIMPSPQLLRTPTPAGAPIILAPRIPTITSTPTLLNGGPPPPLVSASDGGLMYSPYEYSPYLTPTAILEYPGSLEQSAAGPYGMLPPGVMNYTTDPHQLYNLSSPSGSSQTTCAVQKARRVMSVREHPYNRVSLP